MARSMALAPVLLIGLGCGSHDDHVRPNTSRSRATTTDRAAPADDGSIPVVWRVERTGALALHIDGARLLADDGAEALVLDAASGAVRARTTPPPRASGFDDQPRVALLEGRLVTEPEPGALAIGDVDGTERWRMPCMQPSFDACRVRAVAAAGAIVIATGRSSLELVARDAATGVQRWHHAPDSGMSWSHGVLAADDARVYVSTYNTHELVALDARTGAPVWRAECDAAYGPTMGRGPGDCAGISSDGRRVATIAVSGSEVLVLDAANGTRQRHLLGRDLGFATLVAMLAGDALVLGGLASAEAGAVGCYDLASGAMRWSFRTPEPVRSVVARADVVWARGIYGTLWRLDLRDGRVLSRWGFRRGHQVLAAGDHLLIDDGNDVVAIDPRRATRPDPEIRVTGIAALQAEEGARTAGLRVRVGDDVVTTDALGAFEAIVRGRGGVHAWVEGDPASPCDEVDSTFFVPAAAQATPVSLRRVARVCRGE
ncbi:MAG: PQQ-binding-like beta-propeller repeat protein [Deltaproteobacteria bacterium]|nr:PQQ-binding-like beta-propeller repeat protein [Deltaproteobacteria bacterium]